MAYTERLKSSNYLYTMKNGRLKGYMIEIFRVVHGFSDKLTSIEF